MDTDLLQLPLLTREELIGTYTGDLKSDFSNRGIHYIFWILEDKFTGMFKNNNKDLSSLCKWLTEAKMLDKCIHTHFIVPLLEHYEERGKFLLENYELEREVCMKKFSDSVSENHKSICSFLSILDNLNVYGTLKCDKKVYVQNLKELRECSKDFNDFKNSGIFEKLISAVSENETVLLAVSNALFNERVISESDKCNLYEYSNLLNDTNKIVKRTLLDVFRRVLLMISRQHGALAAEVFVDVLALVQENERVDLIQEDVGELLNISKYPVLVINCLPKSIKEIQKSVKDKYKSKFGNIQKLLYNKTNKTPIDEIYINPTIIIDSTNRHISTTDYGTIFTSNNKRKIIHLLGESGSGKTYFCKKMLYDWSNDELTLNSRFAFLFYVELKCVKRESVIDYLIKMFQLSKLKSYEFKRFFFEFSSVIGIILDGYDEFDKSQSEYVWSLVNARNTEMGFTLFVTKNLHASPSSLNLHESAAPDFSLIIKGFTTQKQKDNYMEKFFQKNESISLKSRIDLKTFICDYNASDVTQLSYLPLILNFLCTIWIEMKKNQNDGDYKPPPNRTRLFEEIVQCSYRQHCKGEKIWYSFVNEESTLKKLGQLCFERLSKRKYILPLKEILVIDSNLDKIGFFRSKSFGIMNSSSNNNNNNNNNNQQQQQQQQQQRHIKTDVVFSHKTIQEYLAACYVTEVLLQYGLTEDLNKQFKNTNYIERQLDTIQFIAELSSDAASRLPIDLIEKCSNPLVPDILKILTTNRSETTNFSDVIQFGANSTITIIASALYDSTRGDILKPIENNADIFSMVVIVDVIPYTMLVVEILEKIRLFPYLQHFGIRFDESIELQDKRWIYQHLTKFNKFLSKHKESLKYLCIQSPTVETTDILCESLVSCLPSRLTYLYISPFSDQMVPVFEKCLLYEVKHLKVIEEERKLDLEMLERLIYRLKCTTFQLTLQDSKGLVEKLNHLTNFKQFITGANKQLKLDMRLLENNFRPILKQFDVTKPIPFDFETELNLLRLIGKFSLKGLIFDSISGKKTDEITVYHMKFSQRFYMKFETTGGLPLKAAAECSSFTDTFKYLYILQINGLCLDASSAEKMCKLPVFILHLQTTSLRYACDVAKMSKCFSLFQNLTVFILTSEDINLLNELGNILTKLSSVNNLTQLRLESTHFLNRMILDNVKINLSSFKQLELLYLQYVKEEDYDDIENECFKHVSLKHYVINCKSNHFYRQIVASQNTTDNSVGGGGGGSGFGNTENWPMEMVVSTLGGNFWEDAMPVNLKADYTKVLRLKDTLTKSYSNVKTWIGLKK